MRYYCPIFKVTEWRLSEVIKPAPGQTVSCKAGLEQCLFYFQIYAFTVLQFSQMSIPSLAVLNGGEAVLITCQ